MRVDCNYLKRGLNSPQQIGTDQPYLGMLKIWQCDIKKPQVKMYKELKENLGAETEVIVVFNKVDLMVQRDNIQEFTSDYFEDQIEKSHTKLNCKKDAIHFSCMNPICPDTLKKVGVLGFEELMKVVHPQALNEHSGPLA